MITTSKEKRGNLRPYLTPKQLEEPK
ncbi:hypothetical protein N7449_007684 [Penicillium cf. viridicatum]|uniref:Uncharacterized protein n=1 Tax=Penicillium cf. viridicatum TaxID=2972119 RepID=A0A9W9JLN2_9EURO|nr:hypothetical protein N7449_007684 [Penicillium cf. viridicatum]